MKVQLVTEGMHTLSRVGGPLYAAASATLLPGLVVAAPCPPWPGEWTGSSDRARGLVRPLTAPLHDIHTYGEETPVPTTETTETNDGTDMS